MTHIHFSSQNREVPLGSPTNFWYHGCLSGLNSQTNKPMEKSRTLGTNMVCACYLLLQEANFHIRLICFDHNFGHPHIDVVTFVPRGQSKKPQFFPQKNIVFC